MLVARTAGEDDDLVAPFDEPIREGPTEVAGPARDHDASHGPPPVAPRFAPAGECNDRIAASVAGGG